MYKKQYIVKETSPDVRFHIQNPIKNWKTIKIHYTEKKIKKLKPVQNMSKIQSEK